MSSPNDAIEAPVTRRRSLRWGPAGSLAGRMLLLVTGAVLVTAIGLTTISVHTAQSSLRRSLARTVPAVLETGDRRLRALMDRTGRQIAQAARTAEPDGDLRASDPELAATFTTITSVAAEPEIERPGLAWRPDSEGALRLVWLHPEGSRLWIARPTEAAVRGAFVSGLLPEGADLRLVPDPPRAHGPPAPAGGWPERPTPYRNPSGELVFGGSRSLPGMASRLVLEVPFERAFAPVSTLTMRIALLGLLLAAALGELARRVTRTITEPIHALSDAARRVSAGDLEADVEVPSQDELALLTRTFNDMTGELRRQRADLQNANERLTQQNQALQTANEVLGQLSITDGLTKLHNHRFFQDYLTREIKRVGRTGAPFSMLLIDIDDFKRLNDQLGHASGDELLTRVAEILHDCVREADLVARYGGEEFVVLASDTETEGAYLLAEKIRTTIADASFLLDDTMRLTKMTVSIGVNSFRGSRKAFFQGADDALYQAKAEGKNVVVVFEDPDAEGRPPSA
jgi:diguanylate cyclase (GGDEF)-like protein